MRPLGGRIVTGHKTPPHNTRVHPRKRHKSVQHRIHKNFTRFPLDFFKKILYSLTDPKRKEGDTKMNYENSILLADLEDMIYGHENHISER